MMNSMKNMFRKCWSCSHQGKPEFDRRRGLRDAGMLLDEGRHAGKLAQALSQSDQAEERRGSDGQAPQGVYPAPADPNPWGDSLLGSHPVAETQAIVRIAEAGAERLGRGRLREWGHRPIAFCHRSRLAITASVTKLCERRALVEGDMVGLSVMGIALVVDIAHMHANDRATDPSGLGISNSRDHRP